MVVMEREKGWWWWRRGREDEEPIWVVYEGVIRGMRNEGIVLVMVATSGEQSVRGGGEQN